MTDGGSRDTSASLEAALALVAGVLGADSVELRGPEGTRISSWSVSNATGSAPPGWVPTTHAEVKGAVAAAPVTLPDGDVGALVAHAARPWSDPTRVSGILDATVAFLEHELDRVEEHATLHQVSLRVVRAERAATEALTQAEAANRELDQFAYLAAHELMSPLRAVAAYTDLLPSLAAAATDPAGRANLEHAISEIQGGTQGMQAQVEALLELSRVSDAQIETEPVEVAAVVEAAWDTLGDLIETTGAELDHRALMGRVRANSVHLQIVFRNLLENAIRYRHPDRPPRVVARSERGEGLLSVWIEDNGLGVTVEDADRIFGIFQRGQKGSEGAGIGLALALRVVRRYGGTMAIEPETDQGAGFRVDLPAV